MSLLKYCLWLSSATSVRPEAKTALLRHYGSAEKAYFAPEGEFVHIEGISYKDAAILEKRDISRCEFIQDECAEQDISIITIEDSAYPKRLKNIFAPPVVLYVKGKIKNFDELPIISVIGTRKASTYGLKMGRKIASEVCQCGGTVISMLTEGIDSEAARGALLAGGKCIGILGTAHEKQMSRLYEDILSKGSLISEYPPGTKPQRSFFRDRNRVASGLSLGVVVVEAPERSGTRLFVYEAAEQGREIFAVPGNADAVGCEGTNTLIKEGAKLVTNGSEIMEEFEALYPEAIKLRPDTVKEPPARSRNAEPEIKKPHTDTEKEVDKEKSKDYICLHEQLAALNDDQLKIITAIDSNAVHIDDIIENTGLSAAKVLAQLTVLEIKGYVKREPGRRVSLKIAKK